MEKRNPHERARSHFMRTYLTKEQLDLLLERNLSMINRYAYIFHDKDKSEDGKLKEPHFHVWLKFKDKRSYKNVEIMFTAYDDNGKLINNHDELCVSDIVAQRYLIHIDDSEKAQYDESDVVSYNLNYTACLDSRYHKDAESNTCYQILNDMLDRVPTIELVRRYGKDFLYHINSYNIAFERIRNEDLATRVRYQSWIDNHSGHYGVIDMDTGTIQEFQQGEKIKC